MRTTELIRDLGAEWRAPIAQQKPAKFLDRRAQLTKKERLIKQCLPEYRAGGFKCLDMSCGNGVLLEILRHYGNEIMGAEVRHFEFLRTQGVPHIKLDGDHLPYPFYDQSYDLVTCVGSITFYEAPWPDVLSEFFRIARRTVFLQVNLGWILDAHRVLLDTWEVEGWTCVMRDMYRFKWERA